MSGVNRERKLRRVCWLLLALFLALLIIEAL